MYVCVHTYVQCGSFLLLNLKHSMYSVSCLWIPVSSVACYVDVLAPEALRAMPFAGVDLLTDKLTLTDTTLPWSLLFLCQVWPDLHTNHLFTGKWPFLSSYSSIFPHFILPKSTDSLPFPSFDTTPTYPDLV